MRDFLFLSDRGIIFAILFSSLYRNGRNSLATFSRFSNDFAFLQLCMFLLLWSLSSMLGRFQIFLRNKNIYTSCFVCAHNFPLYFFVNKNLILFHYAVIWSFWIHMHPIPCVCVCVSNKYLPLFIALFKRVFYKASFFLKIHNGKKFQSWK